MNEMTSLERHRSMSWQDPRPTARAGASMTGLDFLQSLIRGDLPVPPFGVMLDFDFTEASDGRAVFRFRPQEMHCNPMGTVHGGVSATLIDSAAGCAVHSTLAAGEVFSTIDLATTLVRPILPGGPEVQCEGRIVHRGRAIATAEARITDAKGVLYAYGHVTAKITQLQRR